jgi:uncharacterized protein HemY
MMSFFSFLVLLYLIPVVNFFVNVGVGFLLGMGYMWNKARKARKARP